MSNCPRPEYPRPQFQRVDWLNLNGEWSYEFDFGKSAEARQIEKSRGFEHKIIVPFCPESKLSKVEHTDFIEQMVYHRVIVVPEAWRNRRVWLNFGAVDYECQVYVNGKLAGRHWGGNSSFGFDITDLQVFGENTDLVVLVKDNLRSGVQPSGKQSDRYGSYDCCYTRITGIWQTVWLEPVDVAGLKRCRITPDLDNGKFCFEPEFETEKRNRCLKIQVFANGKLVGETQGYAATGQEMEVKLTEIRPWSPEDPFLYDIIYLVMDSAGTIVDKVTAYCGLRKIHIEGKQIFLNNQPIFLRLVLDQGYYPDALWTAPSDADLKRDIELAQSCGFNGARLHQKVFEPRFHYWADHLGYLTWGESPSWGCYFADRFSNTSSREKPAAFWQSIFNFEHEWREILQRDYNVTSIIAWTPLNETGSGWNPEVFRQATTDIYDLTKQLDPTRPCNEASGYEHFKTDLWTVHLYRQDAEALQKDLFNGPHGVFQHQKVEEGYCGQPYLNDEFGGFLFIPAERQKFAANTWGYYEMELKNFDQLCAKIAEQVKVMEESGQMAGYCYTQLTDVEQEQNGLFNYDRTPKGEVAKLRRIFGKNKNEK